MLSAAFGLLIFASKANFGTEANLDQISTGNATGADGAYQASEAKAEAVANTSSEAVVG